MIPLTIAEEIRTTLLDYLTTTFSFQDQAVEQALLNFFAPQQPGNTSEGLFKGPYLSLRLPFRKADPGAAVPLAISPSFTPYAHQMRAFERLSAGDGHPPQPTLITTGTGSGKTECFLYPILDYCYAHRGEPGVKAVILYPMNALAGDQAARLARLLAADERLNGQVTAGMYIGGEAERRHGTMGPDHLIDDRQILRKRPPDILLTNYRMLDFLLLRPEDKTLWAENTPETLRFLVLDELHTYDGAQGSDVACLIRRLKARLGIPEGLLCPVGTSATVAGEQGNARQQLTEYAAQIFGEAFPLESVIVEDRQALDDFFPHPPEQDAFPANVVALAAASGESYTGYIARLSNAFFGQELEPVPLAEALRAHSLLHALLAQTGNAILALDDLLARLERWDADFGRYSRSEQATLLGAFLALVAHARVKEGEDLQPFLTCQVQLWVREISRLMREVCTEPRFFWRDDIPLSSERRGLPAYYCRECGHSGWLAFRREDDDYLVDDLKIIYTAYFDHSRHIRYVYPRPVDAPLDGAPDFVCPSCLTVSDDNYCKACRQATVAVKLHIETGSPKKPKEHPKDIQRCPLCGTDGALSLVGSQAASLSSVAISHLYTTPLNRDKKLLAFTDSVQDASHRASFFEARTYRFSLRTAIQAALGEDGPIALPDLPERLLAHWRQAWGNSARGEPRLAAAFLPPDLHDLADYQNYMDQAQKAAEQSLDMALPMPPELDRILRRRLSWEITMEYGFTARVGRSLEKVGSSVAYLDPARLDRAAEHLALILPQENGALVDLDTEALRYFLLGLLERTRIRGGIEHPLLDAYVHDQGNWYLLTHKIEPLLSPFHKNSPRFPRFLTDAAERDVFDLFVTSGSRLTWFVDWAQKTLGRGLGLVEINDLYRQVAQALAQLGLLKKHAKGTANAYGLPPEHLWVTRQAAILKCSQCGHLQTVSQDDVAHWLNGNCLNYRCLGRYTQQALSDQHYYREVYRRGQVERIFAHEHTGLLRRETREKVEKQFKQQTRPDATNLLAATPTLEMGIDIGDLSSTLACSVPPAPANYLQRIGRAGRKTGNSLILTLANARPHDLYFFEEPLEMMAGSITPPGCYLDAPDMLKRQFLAFCMDSWTVHDPKASLLPHNVQKMLAGLKKGGFPENLLAYFERHRQGLVDGFLAIFGPVTSPETQGRLQATFQGDAMLAAVRQAIADVEAEREELRAARKQIKTRRDKVEADPAQYQDPATELKRLEQDMGLLLDMIKQLEDQYILNFFTDAGLLPNYAFPETGVRLTGVISGLDRPGPDGKPYSLREYVRPAALALREIAPFNHFYAEAHKLTISHIEIAGREKAVERWQFCDQCSHMELIQASHYHAACPVCGSTLWADQGQQHNMIRFRKATAYVEHRASQVNDDGDDRQRQSYKTGHFFEMDPAYSRGASLLSALPFGIEYLDQVTLNEINFGPAETISQNILIGGEERPVQGFKTCRDCGLTLEVAPRPDGGKPPRHTRNCAASTNPQTLDWENIYLYRTVTSEAIRILLPVSTTLVNEKMATFEACLDLGLRKKFRGSPDHLHILSHTEPAEDGSRRRYLVIYDSVPGGTGFLKDLARPENFFEILQLALNTLTSCQCRLTPEKQACYRCLYSYRAQRDLKLISRSLGIEMLSEILAQRQHLEVIPSLSHTHIESLVESELEQRFVYALAKSCKGKVDRSLIPMLYNGKQAWELKLGETHWIIEPQVLLGPGQKVPVTSRADFVFWPQNPPGVRPVAVFTDGFAYHVKPDTHQGGIADDLLKRRALIESDQFWVWSIVWDDVKAFEEDKGSDFHFLASQQVAYFEQSLAGMNSPLPKGLLEKNAVESLLALLRKPELSIWTQAASLLMLAALRPPRPRLSGEILAQKAAALSSSIPMPDLSIPDDAPAGEHFYNVINKRSNHLLVNISLPAVQNKQIDAFSATLRLEDQQSERSQPDFRYDWHQFWLLNNLLQFLPGFVPVSAENIQLIDSQAPTETPPAIPSASDEWNTVFQFSAPDAHALLMACQADQWPAPEVGYELVGDNGKIVAIAELAWDEQQIAVFLPASASEQQIFADSGWHTFTTAQIEQVLEQWANA